MKKITTLLFIALSFLGTLSTPVAANSNSSIEAASLLNAANSGGYYRINGRDTHEFRIFLYEGHTDVLVVGDGSTDLDLYVYDGDGKRAVSESSSDDEKVCLNPIHRRGYFVVRVVNRGSYANDYRLIIK